MVVQRHLRSKSERVEEYGNKAEKPATKELAVRDANKGKPAWKIRNQERKSTGTQFRFSESQLKLLQAAKSDQEISIQKILENIVWPVLEEQYGEGSTPTEGQSPS